MHPSDRRAALGEGASVRLLFADAEQEIYRSASRPDQPAWLALWAGDVDGDGRLDYMDLSASYNVSRRVLLLSSAAAPGDMVRGGRVVSDDRRARRHADLHGSPVDRAGPEMRALRP